MIHSQNI